MPVVGTLRSPTSKACCLERCFKFQIEVVIGRLGSTVRKWDGLIQQSDDGYEDAPDPISVKVVNV